MEIIFIFWKACVVLLLAHYLFFHFRLWFVRKRNRNFHKPVSVIICARNESENLKRNLPQILEQAYREFEVLVVNDNSTDETNNVLAAFQRKYSHLRILSAPKKANKGKKAALKEGISNARFDVVLLTDADCRPAGKHWLSSMVAAQDQKEIILGFGAYERSPGWLNFLVRWETLQTAISYFSLAKTSIPYMGVGRNLCYRKSIFEGSTQFSKHWDLASGDDDLLIGEIATSGNTAVNLERESFTYSTAPDKFALWWRQKRRHFSTATFYKPLPKAILLLYGMAQTGFYLLLIPLLFEYGFSGLIWSWIVVKFGAQLLIWLPVSIKLKSWDVMILMPLWEMLLTIFTVVIHLQNRISGIPEKWN